MDAKIVSMFSVGRSHKAGCSCEALTRLRTTDHDVDCDNNVCHAWMTPRTCNVVNGDAHEACGPR
jgi:hypothetical protein